MNWIDAFAGVLGRLRDKGSIPCSVVSRAGMKKLQPLIDANVLSVRARGRGGVLHLESMEHLLQAIDSNYPSGLEQTEVVDSSRGSAVLWRRDSKKRSERSAIPVLLKGLGNVRLLSGDASKTMDVSELTSSFGVAALMLRKDKMDIEYSGKIATVENLEVFTEFHRICKEDTLVVYTGGRASGLLVSWLSSSGMAAAAVTHYGDYDPVGLSEYLRIKEGRSGPTNLFIPVNLETLVDKYGSTELLEKSSNLIPGLRECSDSSATQVLSILMRKNKALEQEILLKV